MRTFCILLFIFGFISCDKSSGQNTATQKGTDFIQEQVTKALQDYVMQPGRSVDEIKKLHQLEYNVFTLALEDSAARYEGVLDELGKNRWDCFHVEKVFSTNKNGERVGKLLFFCKRAPDTLLRFVPKSLIGR
jgi:hypothetical protein